jgi:hypothetical protein
MDLFYPIKYARREYLDKMDKYKRKQFLQKNIKFDWFIDETTLLDAILTMELHHYKYDYLVDDDFKRYVFNGITVKDARYIAQKLIRESLEDVDENTKRWNKSVNWPGCSKGRYILSQLSDSKDKDDFWIRRPDCLLSYVRRIHCICHESGSFHKSNR